FLARAFSSIGLRDQFWVAANGITRFGLTGDAIRAAWFPVPPYDEQKAIADFLDRETAKTDALVEKKERLIELLQEKRTALITHAVTKGLDSSIPMKDSGIEWLGQIPDHWEKLHTQDCANLAVGFAFPSDSFLHGESDVGIKLVRGDNVTTGALRWGERTRRWPSITPDISHLLLKENDIVIGMDGSKVGRNYALVRSEDLPLLLVQRVARLRPKQRISAKYLFFSIANPRFHMHVDLEKSDPAIPHVTGWAIAHYTVLLPSLEEQDAIVAYVERETAKIDALIAKIQEAIERLKEYRTALISAAVTGKIDVRNE
ncbi:MAG: restriction endonuclease subunit S, partial [Candidatus Bipolaricaulota bacterium]|nr:restriction endonuclease subunit S [Candidatus Bipolaricaulota bacterium]